MNMPRTQKELRGEQQSNKVAAQRNGIADVETMMETMGVRRGDEQGDG
jgi:hypothetical protein